MVQTIHWYRQHKGTDGAMVQTAQWYRWRNGTDSAMVQTIHWYRQREGTDGAMVQTAQWYRRRNGTDGTMVQTAQWYRQRNGTDNPQKLAADVHMVFVYAISAEDQRLTWSMTFRESRYYTFTATMVPLYFHCYNGATVLQLGLVHLQGTYSLLGAQHILLQITIMLDW